MRNNFNFILEKKKETISEISRKTGISRTTLTNLYYQRNKAISLDVLEKICIYLNCSVSDILECKINKQRKGELN
ncbi:helix-turn-helix transcriptional regulator [Bacillus cytotoxicus]|nr:helix-turn-helix transcriptional regulator [Bacillus cytotoxicus]